MAESVGSSRSASSDNFSLKHRTRRAEAPSGKRWRMKSREMVFLKKRTEVEARSETPVSTAAISSKSSSSTIGLESLGFGSSRKFLASRTQDVSTPLSSSVPLSSTQPMKAQKTPFCPYQFLYYTMLLEYTTDKSFRIINPLGQRNSFNN